MSQRGAALLVLLVLVLVPVPVLLLLVVLVVVLLVLLLLVLLLLVLLLLLPMLDSASIVARLMTLGMAANTVPALAGLAKPAGGLGSDWPAARCCWVVCG